MATQKPIKEERFVFETEWYDQQADIIRHYRLFFFPRDNSIEMFDKKMNRVFLKRIEIPTLRLCDLFIGARVTVLSRVLIINGYGDVATSNKQAGERESTFGMIKPDAYPNFGKIIDAVQKEGFVITKMKMSRFTPETTDLFYGEHINKPFFANLKEFITSDVVIGMELTKANGIQAWRDFIGPTNTQKAKEQAPNSIRALFGTDGTKNAVHGSDSPDSARRELDFFFGGDSSKRMMKTTGVLNSCSLCIIKPHIINNGQAGQVIDMILKMGFEISAAEMFYLSRPIIEEFYDVYKGVIPEYLPVIEHLSNGPSIALEVRQENVVTTFRDFVGPHDPEIAKHIRSHTLRAHFG